MHCLHTSKCPFWLKPGENLTWPDPFCIYYRTCNGTDVASLTSITTITKWLLFGDHSVLEWKPHFLFEKLWTAGQAFVILMMYLSISSIKFMASHTIHQMLLLLITLCDHRSITTKSMFLSFVTFLETKRWNPANGSLLFFHVVIKSLKKYFFVRRRLSTIKPHAGTWQRDVFLYWTMHSGCQTKYPWHACMHAMQQLPSSECRSLERHLIVA